MYPKGYEIQTIKLPNGEEVGEHIFFHILFVKQFTSKGAEKYHAKIQKFPAKDWEQTKQAIQKWGIGITGQDEYGVVHDPAVWRKEQEAKAKMAKARAAKKEKEVKPEPKA